MIKLNSWEASNCSQASPNLYSNEDFPMDCKVCPCPEKNCPPHRKSGLFSWGWCPIGVFRFFPPFFKVSKTHGIPWSSLCNLKHTMLISHKKLQERKKRVPLVELNPIYVKLDHFPPIFQLVKNAKKRIFEVSPHSNWLASPHSLEKKVSPEKLSQRSDFTLSCLATRGTRLVGTRTDLKTLSPRPYFGGGRGNWPKNTQPKFEGKSRYPHGKYSCQWHVFPTLSDSSFIPNFQRWFLLFLSGYRFATLLSLESAYVQSIQVEIWMHSPPTSV